jgi:small subunit ribosomal protein S23
MGRYDFRPSKVHDAATQLLATKKIASAPPWYEAVGLNPPPQILVRTVPVQHNQHKKGTKKPSKLFRPQRITYIEDSLRKNFFKDHPWELARPRIVLEGKGKNESTRQNWDKIRQPGEQLLGEKFVH